VRKIVFASVGDERDDMVTTDVMIISITQNK